MPNLHRTKPDHLAKLMPDCCYHVYNRTNNHEKLFSDDIDRKYFLEQYRRFVVPYVETYAYCLLPNHFHLAIRIKPAPVLITLAEQTPESERTVPQRKILDQSGHPEFHPLTERQFTRMFTAYALYFNRRYQRSGNLFYRPFKRVAVVDEAQLQWLVYYIHHNPRKHGITEDFLHYVWSSYPALSTKRLTALQRDAVWNIFGGMSYFLAFHEGYEPQKPDGSDVEIED